MNKIQSIELDILKKFHKIFEENKIDYFLCGGTMLGAIRHKGFIPWDDDIDIGMTRENYIKFIEFAKNNNCEFENRYLIKAGELDNTSYPFAKIEDRKYEITKRHSVADKYVFIDIFPFDNLPESENETKKCFKKSLLLKKLICYKNIDLNYLKTRTNNKLKVFIELFGYYTIMKMIPMKTLLNKSKKLTNKYIDTEYIGCIVWGYGPGERVLKTDLESVDVNFEGVNLKGMKGYDKYLKGLYGDYMSPPSKDKIFSHETEIKEVKGFDKK